MSTPQSKDEICIAAVKALHPVVTERKPKAWIATVGDKKYDLSNPRGQSAMCAGSIPSAIREQVHGAVQA